MKVRITEDFKNLSTEVISEGETLDPAEQSQIFEAFVRGHNAEAAAGSGLGLRIVKRILEAHHAQIIYDVPAPNLNRFTLIFPKELENASAS